MRQNQASKAAFDKAFNACLTGIDLDHPAAGEVIASDVMDALDKAGFAIVAKPKPGSTSADRVEFARRTGCWDGVSDRDYMEWVRSLVPGTFVIRTVEELYRSQPVRLEPGRAEPTEVEKAARWASVLIAQILEDGSARQTEAGVDAAAEEALARLKRDRGRVAFEDLDKNPPMAAGGACELLASWVRSLGDVNWCEVRLLPRRLVLAASVRGRPSCEQEEDLGRRLDMIRAFRGVVGVSPGVRGLHSEDGVMTYEVEVRFDHYITTVGCDFAPLDLPARPARKAA